MVHFAVLSWPLLPAVVATALLPFEYKPARLKRAIINGSFLLFLQKTVVPKLTLFIPAFIWAAVIYILLVMPADDVPSGGVFSIPNFDKLVHAGLFGMLVLLATFPFFRSKYASASFFLKIAIIAILYGVVMEFVQKYFTADRDFDVWDMFADAFGALVGCVWMNMCYKRFLRKRAIV